MDYMIVSNSKKFGEFASAYVQSLAFGITLKDRTSGREREATVADFSPDSICRCLNECAEFWSRHGEAIEALEPWRFGDDGAQRAGAALFFARLGHPCAWDAVNITGANRTAFQETAELLGAFDVIGRGSTVVVL